MIDRLVERLRNLWRRLARRLTARPAARTRHGFPLGGAYEPAEYARGIPWVPRSDGRPFNPQDSALFKKLQRRATYALLAELGQKWVPAEIFRILDAEGRPTKALEIFCAEFGLKVELLKQRSQGEIASLTECLDLLFFLHDIGARLPSATREQIVNAIRARDYHAAAGMIDTFRLALRLLDDAVEMAPRIPFPQYRAFVAFLQGFANDWLRLSLRDIEVGLETCRHYRDLNQRFDRALSRLDARIEWVSKYWPGNRWGRDNLPARDRMIALRRQIEAGIRAAAAWDMARLEQAIAELERLVDDFGTLGTEMNDNSRRRREEWQEPADEPHNGDGVAIWAWALEALGFATREQPSPAEIRTAFCRQALRYHPDRNVDQPDEVKLYHREKFEEATRAREILDRGAPPRQAEQPMYGRAANA